MRDLLERLFEQLVLGVAHERAERRVDPQELSVRSDLGHADRGVVESAPEALLAQPQRLLGGEVLRDVLGENDDAADRAVGVTPGPDLPAQPVDRPVRAQKRIPFAVLDRSSEAALMDRPPFLADLWKDLVVAAVEDLALAEAVVGAPAFAVQDVTHLAIEHGDRHRSVTKEEAKPGIARLVPPFGRLGPESCRGGIFWPDG